MDQFTTQNTVDIEDANSDFCSPFLAELLEDVVLFFNESMS
ncbi:MAG: hypothetical protein AAF242_11280 [Bacteroidota bacterium]